MLYIVWLKSGVPDMHVDTIMESKDATFFEEIFPMKEVDSTSGHELSINNEPKEPAVLIKHNEQPNEENPEEDGNEALRKSK
jgi:hypothetical protein